MTGVAGEVGRKSDAGDHGLTAGIAGMGRSRLESEVERLRAELTATHERARAAESLAASATRERDMMFVNLTEVQATCTRQLEELRAWRRGEPLDALVERLAVARMKHPEGSDLTSLVAEVGEVARAMYLESEERVREELLDVAVVAMRLYLGEVKAREVGFRRDA